MYRCPHPHTQVSLSRLTASEGARVQHPATRRALLPAIAVAASLIVSLPSPAHASPVPTSVPTSVAAATDGIARQLAAALVQPRVRATVASAVASGPADLASIAVGAPFDR